MRKIVIFIIFILFILKRETVAISAADALYVWSKTIFPLLFPTFIISDLLLSSGIIKYITRLGGKIFAKIFNTSKYGLYIFIISLLSGTPTNAKNLKMLYDSRYINETDLIKILSFSYFYNPFFVISFTGIRILLILWASNMLTGILFRNLLVSDTTTQTDNIDINFDLNDSIQKNMNILFSILGTMTVFFVVSNLIPIDNELIKTVISGFLEVTSGLNRIKVYFSTNDVLSLIILSFGGLSIFMQVKSILKDTNVNYKYFWISRIFTMIISLIICVLT